MKEQNDNHGRSVGFLVDGKIINELSRQVSSHLFALGELMKNSYDAKSTKINITFNKKEKLLVIEDDGAGISNRDFSSLLHIAKSGKEYGKKFSFKRDKKAIIRYTQGSKGLGLFCAFKFGDLVIWDTKFENESSKLKINKNEVIKKDDISKVNFPIDDGSRDKNGTTITIAIDPNDEDINYIYNFFKSSKNSNKIIRYFHEDDINISIDLIDENGKSENGFPKSTESKRKLNNEYIEKQVFKIHYDSERKEITYKYKDGRTKIIKYELTKELKDFKIVLHINAYQLRSGGVNKISSIFHNNMNELSPLVYINDVMFNNDQLFNPSITRKVSSKQTLPQLTGFIEIVCTNAQLQFNNERTDLVRNSYNESIRESINNLNKEIQLHGRSIINEFGPSTLPVGQYPLFEESIPEQDTEIKKGQETKSDSTPQQNSTDCTADQDSNLHADTNNTEKTRPYITLTKSKEEINFFDESETINIHNYFKEAKDSQGQQVPLSKISISIDDKIVSDHYIQPIRSSQKLLISFFFNDDYLLNHEDEPFKAIRSLTLNFVKQAKRFQNANNEPLPLISPIGDRNYTIKLEGVGKLISQINLLAENHNKYDMCIAASIRVLFDLTTYRYQQFAKVALTQNALEKQVEEIVQRIVSENHNYSKVSALIGPRFRLIKNIFDPGLFASRVTLSNLGAHTGSSHVSRQDIEDIAKYAGYYAQLVDAHLKVKGFIDK